MKKISTQRPQLPVAPYIGEDYARLMSGWDEMHADGQVRAPWKTLVTGLNSLGAEEVARRQSDVRRLLRENGVTYNVYGDPQGRHRTWELDPVPHIINADDWAVLASGLQQRAELLNLVLTDLYGQRQLIKQGILPPELVFAHPGFLRPCEGVRVPGAQQLLFYAADLARGQDGRMWVFADRSQVPTGAGYALENRMVMARVLPQELRDNQVQRLSSFFRSFTQNLQKIAQNRREEPYIVVLTPGASNETYFEHAYFAHYMGYPLVQGGDLVVRDNRVWLKSLDGLKQVDVILRRVDDAFCDPLELRGDSILGVPGLLNAARAGHVVIANPLGSSVLESRGLLPFLNACARHFLDEDLKLPSVATWWCGQPTELGHVLANLDKLVVKSTYPGGTTWFGPSLTAAEREALVARIRACPRDFVGQEYVEFSTVPALVSSGEIEPRHMMFRGFLLADGKGYNVMPGGLTRVARERDSLFISNQHGGVSKDTWVLTSDVSRQARPTSFVSAPMLNPQEDKLPSRAAENLYWVGRYAERVEGVMRLMRVAMDKLAECKDYGDEADVAVLNRLLESLTVLTASQPGFVGEGAEAHLLSPHAELLELARNRDRHGSLPEMLSYLLNAAYNVRDLWSGDTWRTVGAIESGMERLAATPARLFDVRVELDRLVHELAAFTGITAESMRHDHAWVLLDMGRRMERAVQLAQLLDQCMSRPLVESAEPLLMEALLACSESVMVQRRRFRYPSQVLSALDLLVLDDRHPRSLAYQLERLSARVDMLPPPGGRRGAGLGERYSVEAKLVLEAATALKMSTINGLAGTNERGERGELRVLLARLRGNLWQLSTELSKTYFSHAPEARQLAPLVQIPNA